jgi:hypothetical protein
MLATAFTPAVTVYLGKVFRFAAAVAFGEDA